MIKSRDTCKDFISGLGPNKGFQRLTVYRHVSSNRCLRFPGAPIDAPPQLLLGKRSEPALEQIDPGATRAGEVQMVPGLLRQPPLNHRGLVRAVVIQNHVDAKVDRQHSVDSVSETAIDETKV